MTSAEQNRYARHIMLPEIGLAGQQRLAGAAVLVVGCGGLGCPVLQYLTAAGVGTIGLLDADTVDETNLQRQVLYSTADVGQLKVEAAQAKLAALNPYVTFRPLAQHLTAANALTILPDYDVVVDCSDNFATRYLVNDACVLLGKPLVFGAIFKFEGQLSVFNYQGGPTYRCLYPEPPEPDEMPSCSDIGVLGVLPGIVGMLQANETLKILLQLGEVLQGKLLVFNSLTMSFQSFSFQAVEANQHLTKLVDYEELCGFAIQEITAAGLKLKLKTGEALQLVDVREPHEHAQRNLGGQLLPLGHLTEHLDKLQPTIPVVVYCQSGGRSRKAARLLQDRGFPVVYSLQNGLADF
ncbi:molybdopterin-synthase adenylyltransferase MoeB [Hymenobacter sp. YC55]|uniref:molybdopterin-synthase adenylyltransferase MoeB n=1 Tax=Hymenobacter sp. YC55 TaxID=3034019 RepID=UPI0023F7AE17|nr:molybdopterin-synthase adenylyltransferase MoeB [Hymenobacter sp. YC55]MDF7815672.1 molybdopterin-synthase adenylyltransferase MoeB [Hymenobacter sp. YC55]